MVNLRKLFARREEKSALGEQAGLWNAIFEEAEFLSTAPRRLQEVQSQMINRLGRVYQLHDRLGRQYAALLQGVIQVADFCEGLNADTSSEGASEGTQAIHRALMDLLEGHGVYRWECHLGDALLEGCEVVGYSERSDLADGVIGGVIAPGYRLSGGEVFRRARVLVNRRPVAPEPTPIEASAPPKVEEEARPAPSEVAEAPAAAASPGVTLEETSPLPAQEMKAEEEKPSPPASMDRKPQAPQLPRHRKGGTKHRGKGASH